MVTTYEKNPWQQLCEFAKQKHTNTEYLLQDPNFFYEILVPLRRNSPNSHFQNMGLYECH